MLSQRQEPVHDRAAQFSFAFAANRVRVHPVVSDVAPMSHSC